MTIGKQLNSEIKRILRRYEKSFGYCSKYWYIDNKIKFLGRIGNQQLGDQETEAEWAITVKKNLASGFRKLSYHRLGCQYSEETKSKINQEVKTLLQDKQIEGRVYWIRHESWLGAHDQLCIEVQLTAEERVVQADKQTVKTILRINW